MTDDTLLAAWDLEQRRRGFSEKNTIARRRRLYTRIRRAGYELATMTVDDFEDWLDSQELSAKSRNQYVTELAAMFKWAVRKGFVAGDPTAEYTRASVARAKPRPIVAADVEVALALARPRMRLWLTLGLFTGLRCCEIAPLTVEAFDWTADPPTLFVIHGKGGHQRCLPVSEAVEKAYRDADLPDAGYLFPGQGGRPHVTAQSVSQVGGKYLRRIGVNASMHQLRHTFASAVYRSSGGDLRATQELLGHSSPEITAIYASPDLGAAAGIVRAFGTPLGSREPRPQVIKTDHLTPTSTVPFGTLEVKKVPHLTSASGDQNGSPDEVPRRQFAAR